MKHEAKQKGGEAGDRVSKFVNDVLTLVGHAATTGNFIRETLEEIRPNVAFSGDAEARFNECSSIAEAMRDSIPGMVVEIFAALTGDTPENLWSDIKARMEADQGAVPVEKEDLLTKISKQAKFGTA